MKLAVCAAPITKGPQKGKAATGTTAGGLRHWRAGEPPCEPCRSATAESQRRWQRANPEEAARRSRQWRAANPTKSAEARRRWKVANPEKVAAASRQWRKANPGRSAEFERRYRAANPEKVLAYTQRWRKANPEKVAAATRRWRAANPDTTAEQARRWRARRRSARTIPFTITELTARLSMFPGCWLCGAEAGTVDHVIPLVRGGWHSLSNLRPACLSCNSSKGARDYRTLIARH